MKETETGRLEPVSAWQQSDFQKFAAIVLSTALVASLIGAFKLTSDVNIATKHNAPNIQEKVSDLEATGALY